MGRKFIFGLSVSLNVLVIIATVLLFFRLGGFVYFENRLANAFSNEPSINPIVKIRSENLNLVGEESKEVVFVGDSHTNYFEWGEYFSDKSVANRGIGSITTEGLLQRINLVTDLNPEKVFIMIGINDIQREVPIDEIVENLEEIIAIIKESEDDVEIYLQSVLPVAGELYERHNYRHSQPVNDAVINLNSLLESIDGVTFIDVASHFNGELSEEYTVDGIHLNQEGYKVWLDVIEEYVYN